MNVNCFLILGWTLFGYFVMLAGHCGHTSPCEQLCYEIHDGMYECDCIEGYELNKNGYSCQGKGKGGKVSIDPFLKWPIL